MSTFWLYSYVHTLLQCSFYSQAAFVSIVIHRLPLALDITNALVNWLSPNSPYNHNNSFNKQS